MQIKVELQGSRFNNQHVYIYIYYSYWLRFSLSPEKWTDDRDSGTARSMIRIYIYIINYIFRCVALYIYIYPFPWLKHQSWFWDLISIELENQIKSSTWFPSFAYHLERKEIISHLDIAFEPVLLPSYMALLALAPTYPELASPFVSVVSCIPVWQAGWDSRPKSWIKPRQTRMGKDLVLGKNKFNVSKYGSRSNQSHIYIEWTEHFRKAKGHIGDPQLRFHTPSSIESHWPKARAGQYIYVYIFINMIFLYKYKNIGISLFRGFEFQLYVI